MSRELYASVIIICLGNCQLSEISCVEVFRKYIGARLKRMITSLYCIVLSAQLSVEKESEGSVARYAVVMWNPCRYYSLLSADN